MCNTDCLCIETKYANRSIPLRVTGNISQSAGMSKKYIVGAGKSQTKLKKPEIKKKNKYSNMKMLYQNAVYKSLNLNLSPSNSSRSNSREIIMKAREGVSSNKYAPVVSRVQDHNSIGAKFSINKSTLSSERKYRINNGKRDLLRDNSEGNFSSKKNINVSQNQSSLTQQFHSPSDSRKILNSGDRTKVDKSNNSHLTGGKTQRSIKLKSDTLYNSYRRSSKSGLRNMGSGSKAKLNKDSNANITNDTFEKNKSYISRSDSKMLSDTPNRLPSETKEFNREMTYTSKGLASLKRNCNDEENQTIDSSRHSNNSYTTNVKEFLEAAANGDRDKLDRMLKFTTSNSDDKSCRISDINCSDINMMTALHYSVSEGRYKTA